MGTSTAQRLEFATERNIAYAPEHGERGQFDLYLPDGAVGSPLAIVIHGGWVHVYDGGPDPRSRAGARDRLSAAPRLIMQEIMEAPLKRAEMEKEVRLDS